MPPGRWTTLAAACLAAFSTGTVYVVSAYAPAMASRLHLSSKATNLMLLSGNSAVYISSPFVGAVVDRRGARLVMIFAAFAIFAGYALLKLFYDSGETGLYSRFGLGPLAFAEVLVGIGTCASYAGWSNGVAKAFDSKRRATALSICISCLGLSAFAYSTLATLLPAHGDPTSQFLALLAAGCGGSILIAARIIRPTPRHQHSSAVYSPLPHDDAHGEPSPPLSLGRERETLSPSPSYSEERSATPENIVLEVEQARARSKERGTDSAVDIGGWELVANKDFLLLFLYFGLLSGCGLMFINNVGMLAYSLRLVLPSPSPDALAPSSLETQAESLATTALQQRLVSLISIFNALGRLLCGPLTDYLSHPSVGKRWTIPRVWFMVPVAGLFVVVNASVARTVNVEVLQSTAVRMGLAYGMLCGSMPVFVLEWFGMASFSTNNGVNAIGPAIFGNTLNLLFGILYDLKVSASLSSSPTPDHLARRAGLPSDDHLCTLGNECFRSAFQLTTNLAVGAFGVAVWLGMRRGRG